MGLAILGLATFFAASPTPTAAATLYGVCVDSAGNGVPTMLISIPGLGAGTQPDSAGHFKFENVAPGNYLVRFYSWGCYPTTYPVTIGYDMAYDFTVVTPCFDFGSPGTRLPVRPKDYFRFPRKGFGFVFQTKGGEMINSFEGRVTKDLVEGPDTTISLGFTESELDTIYKKAIEIRLFERPEGLEGEIGGMGYFQPRAVCTLAVQAGSFRRKFNWDDGLARSSEDWHRVYEFLGLIRRIVMSKPAYQALPRVRANRID